jgi:hypothetical protein
MPSHLSEVCSLFSTREDKAPSSSQFFPPCIEGFQGMEGTKPLKKKMTRMYTNPYNSLGYFCIPVR